jgi:putative two-component system response regulator
MSPTVATPLKPRIATPHTPVILVVDDVAANRELLEGQLIDFGYEVIQATNGAEALSVLVEREPDLVLLDIEMPRVDGIAVCQAIKSHPTRRLVPVILITAANDRATKLRGLEAGADEFLTKPFDAKELRIRTRVLLEERALNKRLDATEGVLAAIARAVEARDKYTIHHAARVARYSTEIGRGLGLPEEDLEALHTGGMLHDLGKIAIPDAILRKPGPLTEEEFAIMRTHSIEGDRICGSLRSVAAFLPIIRHHHERFDGAGYPDHLRGDAIPLGGRIAAVGDAWDAMVSDRPYRAGLGVDEALRRLREGSGTQWDPAHVDIFVSLLDGGIMREDAADPK